MNGVIPETRSTWRASTGDNTIFATPIRSAARGSGLSTEIKPVRLHLARRLSDDLKRCQCHSGFHLSAHARLLNNAMA